MCSAPLHVPCPEYKSASANTDPVESWHFVVPGHSSGVLFGVWLRLVLADAGGSCRKGLGWCSVRGVRVLSRGVVAVTVACSPCGVPSWEPAARSATRCVEQTVGKSLKSCFVIQEGVTREDGAPQLKKIGTALLVSCARRAALLVCAIFVHVSPNLLSGFRPTGTFFIHIIISDEASNISLTNISGPEGSVAMGILLAVFIGLLVMAVILGWMHARKERKRNEMVALSGFADD